MPACAKYIQTHLLRPHSNLFLFLSTYAFCFFPLELSFPPSNHSACSSFNLKWQKHSIAITVFATFTRATLICRILVYFSYAIISQTSLTRNTFSVQCVHMCMYTYTHTHTYLYMHTKECLFLFSEIHIHYTIFKMVFMTQN